MHVNVRECVLNVLVHDPLEALGLRVLVGRAPHLVGERGDRLLAVMERSAEHLVA